MKKILLLSAAICIYQYGLGQDRMTPERLWQLGRVSGVGITPDNQHVVYKVSTPNIIENKSSTKMYRLPIAGGQPQEITDLASGLKAKAMSPDGKLKITLHDVAIKKLAGKEIYPDLPKSNVRIYESLNFRHWDEWEDGAFSHLFVGTNEGQGEPRDIMAGEAFDCPQKPYGGDEDFTWSPDGKQIVYVAKKKYGTAYAISTNTDIYAYDIASGSTKSLSEGMPGYDTQPAFSTKGTLAWLSMKRDGYESDKNDIVVLVGSSLMNLTQHWDGTVNNFTWSEDGGKIYFTAPTQGTVQLYEVNYPGLSKKQPVVKQITSGDFDINTLVGQVGGTLIVSRTDMNHAAELYTVNLTSGVLSQLTHVNDAAYTNLKLSRIEKRTITTTDKKQMPVWVIYPPDFDTSKKYPTLLYCNGGPQSALTQFYSFRWNFQLMAANGYIIVAPDRRGMPGLGVAWNEQISKDWGGQVMNDYLSAIDALSEESFVDNSRLGCIGASYGGYSVFYLAGIHKKRFKTFIAHDGVFNTKSMYGSTEELWFVNWDFGGPYWSQQSEIQKSYVDFNPSSKVSQWDTPILIFQGGKDYRIPLTQGIEAFTAAQLLGLKSKFVYLPDENHWVLSAQNALVWQREFFGWLKETL